MENLNINWGILGTAEIADLHVVPALNQAKNATALAIASSSGKAKPFAEKHRIPRAYGSYEQLLRDPEIDVVYIPLPNHLHSKWVKIAAEHGKHIVCEKPASLSAAETKDMIGVCNHYRVLFMEALMYQFHPQHQRVKEMIADGMIGDVITMRSSFTFLLQKREGNFRLNARTRGGGSLYDIGVYCIHAIRAILGELTNVYCEASLDESTDADWSAVAILQFENGKRAHFDCGMNASTRNEYEIVGTRGTIRVPKAFIPQKDGKGIIEIMDSDGNIRKETCTGNHYKIGVENFSNSLLENKSLAYKPDSSIHNMSVLDACFASIEQNSTVPVAKHV